MPPPRAEWRAIYDVARARTVCVGNDFMFTGSAFGPYGSEWWEWDGTRWHRGPETIGLRRAEHALCYDARRGRTVVYGGARNNGGAPLDVYEFDGQAWSIVATNGPPSGGALAYDLARGECVNVEWSTAGGATWGWNGSAWTLRSTVAQPSQRNGHALAYDVARQRVVLFGGYQAANAFSNETWEWDGSVWTRRSPANVPPGRGQAGLAYDLARGRTVLFGGYGAAGSLNDTWEWDGVNWIQRAPTQSPPRVGCGFPLSYDLARQRTVLVPSGARSDVWEWDGTSWLQASTAPTLPGLMEYDHARGRVVHLGKQFLELDLGRWRTIATSQLPPLSDAALVSDSWRRRLVLYGGLAGSAVWEWDGLNWLRVSPAVSPGPRTGHALAFDGRRGVTVLYGGGTGAQQRETWEWDGARWTQHSPVHDPGPRTLPQMAFDPVRQRVLLVSSDTAREHWEWDGVDWQLVGVVPTYAQRLVTDFARARVLAFAGQAQWFAVYEWTGVSWETFLGDVTSTERVEAVYDAARSKVVSLRTATGGGICQYTGLSTRDYEVYGEWLGPGDSRAPDLGALIMSRRLAVAPSPPAPYQLPVSFLQFGWQASAAVLLLAPRAVVPFVAQAPILCGPTTFYLDPSAAVALPAGVGTGATVVLPIPNDPLLIGASVAAQGLALYSGCWRGTAGRSLRITRD